MLNALPYVENEEYFHEGEGLFFAKNGSTIRFEIDERVRCNMQRTSYPTMGSYELTTSPTFSFKLFIIAATSITPLLDFRV